MTHGETDTPKVALDGFERGIKSQHHNMFSTTDTTSVTSCEPALFVLVCPHCVRTKQQSSPGLATAVVYMLPSDDKDCQLKLH